MVRKAVVLAAGYGSRFLPITRCIPKEMLPVGLRPALDLVISELVDAGITDILILTSRRKKVLEDWFDRSPELEAEFADSPGKISSIAPPKVRVTFVRQQTMRGTGHALLLSRTFVGDEPFVVAYPDDLFDAPNVTAQLIQTHARTGASVLAARDLGDGDVSRYGVLALRDRVDGATGVSGFVEKPPRGTEPSKLVSLGRFLYTPDVFAELEAGLVHHKGGEYYHVHALEQLAAANRLVATVVTSPYHDTGEPLGYAQASVEHMLRHPVHGEAFRRWLHTRVGESGSSG